LRIRPKALALLAQLALAERPVERSVLADGIFPEAADRRAVLRWHLSHLRSALPADLAQALRVERAAVSFIGPSDVEHFRAQVQDVVNHPEGEASAGILALYRGDLCDSLAVNASPTFDSWLYVQQDALRRQFRQAVAAFARHTLDIGAAHEAIPALSRLVAVDPYYEEAHVLLIESYEAGGDREAAGAAYQRYARTLRQDLLVEPRPTTLAERYETRVVEGQRLPEDDLVALGDVTLHVVDWPGADPTILAIHGSIGSAYSLTALAERIAPDHRFIGVDLRGHGLSDKPPGTYRLAQFVTDVVDLVHELDLRSHVLLGFSAGGAIATHAALLTGARGLVLLDGVVGPRAFTERSAAKVVKDPWGIARAALPELRGVPRRMAQHENPVQR